MTPAKLTVMPHNTELLFTCPERPTDFKQTNKTSRRELGYLIRESKMESWRSFWQDIEDFNEVSKLRKILASYR